MLCNRCRVAGCHVSQQVLTIAATFVVDAVLVRCTSEQSVTILGFHDKVRGNISKVTANKPIVNFRGDWLLPFWQEAHTVNDTGPACSGVLVSTDRGASWMPHGFIASNDTWLIENTLAQTERGVIQLFRTQVHQARCLA